MLGDDEILVATAFRTFLVRVPPLQTALTDAQREAGQRLASEFRFGLGGGDPALQVAAQQLAHALGRADPLRPGDASLETGVFFRGLGDFLAEQLEAGRLIVLPDALIANVPEQELTVRRPRREAEPPAQPSRRRDAPLETSFEVRLVDEAGQAISGLEVQLKAGDRDEPVTTNAAGVALLEGTTAGTGSVIVKDPDALEKILRPRWAKRRPNKTPGGLNVTETQFDGGSIEAFGIKAGVPNTLVIKPTLGLLLVELFDKTGRVRHANCDYRISGPDSFSGTTDDQGRLRHEGVHPGEFGRVARG